MKNANKISLVLNLAAILLGLLMALAVFTWASPCSGQLELANGNFVPMKCVHAGKAAVLLGIVLLAAAFDGLWKKHVSALTFVAIGAALLILPVANAVGIGVCVKEAMACQSTALWMRVIGVLTLLDGVVGLFIKGKHDL